MVKSLTLIAARILDYLAAAAMLGILVVTCSSIFARALVNKPIAGALELSMLLMPIVVFGGMAWVFARVGHFAMTSLVEAWPRELRPIGVVLQVVLGAILFMMLSIESAELAYRSFIRGEYFAGPVNVPVYYSRFVIALGSVVTTCTILFILLPEGIEKLRNRSRGGLVK